MVSAKSDEIETQNDPSDISFTAKASIFLTTGGHAYGSRDEKP